VPAALNVNKATVRRFLLKRQELHFPGSRSRTAAPDDVLRLVRKLECVQLDPVAAVERNQHLVLAARMPRYKPKLLEQLLSERRVFEYWAHAACVIPMEDYPIFEVVRRRFRQQLQPELDKLGPVVRDVMKRLEAEGPLPSKAFESAIRVHGYWDNGATPTTKATSHALNVLNDAGLIQVVRREGTTRYFDIPERAVPKHLLEEAAQISEAEAKAALLEKYMRAYRVFDPGDFRFGWVRMTAEERRQAVQHRVEQGSLVPVRVEGIKREYYILAEDVDELLACAAEEDVPRGQSGTIRFLPPLDNLLWRRERVLDLFDFSYTWEVYIPAAKRQYGYYAMPILAGETIIGRMDPRLDRDNGRLNVQLLQIEPDIRWTKSLCNQVLRALEEFARFHGAELGDIERTQPEGLELYTL
jgi:uncharacterized protein YcaQ